MTDIDISRRQRALRMTTRRMTPRWLLTATTAATLALSGCGEDGRSIC